MGFQGYIEKGMVVLDRPLPWPDGTPVRVEPLPAAAAEFWQSCSLNELAARQGVSGPGSVEELLGGWPTDEQNDDFEAALLSWRQGELGKAP